MAYYQNNELYHYGVIGMKWGIRKDPAKAYAKGIRKLEKYDKKATKGLSKVTSINKAKAQKYRMKSAKVRRKATRWLFPMNAEKATRKIAKYDLKAERYENKIRKGSAQYEKYTNKGAKLYRNMEKAFADVPTSKLNKTDIQRGKEYYKLIQERQDVLRKNAYSRMV